MKKQNPKSINKALATILMASLTLAAFGQGTVAFSNVALYRISTAQTFDLVTPMPGTLAQAPPSLSLEYGLFYGIGQSTSLTLLTSQFGVNSTTGAGLIASPADSVSALNLVPIPGTYPNETDVWLQMAGWSASFGTNYVAAHNAALNDMGLWGQSKIANITAGLGASTGPGAAIWASSTDTSGTRMPAFFLSSVPEPAALALVALSTAMLVARRRFRGSGRNNNSQTEPNLMKKTLTTCLLLCCAATMLGQGTVQFNNGATTRISTAQTFDGTTPVAGTAAWVPTTPGLLEYGLFYGIGQSTSLTLLTSQFGVNSTSAVGVIADAADAHSSMNQVPIPGTFPYDTDVFFQVLAWTGSFGTDWVSARAAYLTVGGYWGQSAIVDLVSGLGSTAGPGALIWQRTTGTNPNLLYPFYVFSIPEPSALAVASLAAAILFVRRQLSSASN